MSAPGTPLYPGALSRNVAKLGSSNFPLYFDAGFPLPPAAAFTLYFIRPLGSEFSGVAHLGSGTVALPYSTFKSGEWVFYPVQPGDLREVGTYTVQLGITPSPSTQPPQATFQVIP